MDAATKKESKTYEITGTLRSGKRFPPIRTKTPQCYNIWRGTLWEVMPDGTRKKVREYVN